MTRYNQEKAWSDFRVGLITFTALSLLILGITLVGGDKGLLFQKAAFLKAHLVDVGGLKKGSSVTMSGMVVGRVTQIRFVDDEKTNQIEVTAEVRRDVRNRIKTDSVPAVRTQGMLGDRYLDISAGTETSPPLPEGHLLQGESAADFDKTLRQTTVVLEATEDLIKDFKKNPRRYIKFSVF